MRSCWTVRLEQGNEARRTVVKASAANHGTIPVESFCCRRIVLLHLDLRSGHPCPKRTARATGGVGWAKSLAAWPEMRSVRKRPPVGAEDRFCPRGGHGARLRRCRRVGAARLCPPYGSAP